MNAAPTIKGHFGEAFETKLAALLTERERLDAVNVPTRLRIAQINTDEFSTLRKAVQDAVNAAGDPAARRELLRVRASIDQATSGIRFQSDIDCSPEREADLRIRLAEAKTNSERRAIARELARLVRARDFIVNERDQLATGHEEARRQYRQKKDQKKTKRVLRKLKRIGTQ